MPTLYASFADPADAERAAAALLDNGAISEDIAVLASESYATRWSSSDAEAAATESGAKSGITTTTAGDAAYGAVKGSVVGLGVGTIAALGALLIPGVGIVLAGSAVASALGAALATAAAGAAAGGVAGFLKDQGVGENYVTHYSDALASGGSVLSVNVPTGKLSDVETEQLLAKYGADNVSLTGGDRNLMTGEEPVATTVAPIDGTIAVEQGVPVTRTTLGTVPTAPAAVAAAVNAVNVEPTVVDPITGAMREGVSIDPLTGVERPVQTVGGAVVYADQAPTPGFTLADVVATSTDPATGLVSEGYVVDAAGARRNVRVVNGSIIYADAPRTVVE
jgi:hypothetical protein